MQQLFTGEYLARTSVSGWRIQEAIVTDNDLIRGNDADEKVETPSGFDLFNGFDRFEPGVGTFSVGDPERVTTVTFNDGTMIFGVSALYDSQSGPYGWFTQQVLLDPTALQAAGKTLADVADVRIDGAFDHDLDWSDFGFTPTGEVVPEPEPEPEPVVLTLLEGTNGNDRLIGTDADELIRGGDGDDRLTGNAGADVFVFGADARDGNRDRDVITDFNAAEDTIVLEDGIQIRNWTERNGNLIVTLEGGDRDQIVIRDADSSILANFSVIDDVFMA